MPEAGGIDISSYKLPTQPSFLDIAGKYQGLQQGQQAIQSNAIQIDKQKLDLIKERYGIIAKQIPALISKKDLNQQDVEKFYQNQVNNKFMTPDMYATAVSQIPPTVNMQPDERALTLKNHMGGVMQQGQTVIEALDYHLGKQGTDNTNASINHTLSSPKPGFAGNRQAGGVIQPQPGIPIQPGPTQPTVSQGGPGQPPRGTPSILGPSAPATGLPTAPGSILPGGAQIMGNGTGGVPTAGTPKPVQTQSITTGNPPLFEAGKAQYVQDQQTASAKSQALIPILQAIPLMKDIMAGPGTAGFTHAVAALKAFGFISTDVNDPTAIRQEVVKKLNAYVSTNPISQRSDAAQTLTAASNPSPDIQLLPALTKLAKDAVAQDRTAISRPGAFTNDDFSQYGKHTTNYATNIDQNAMKLDQMEPSEREALKNKYSKEVNGRRIQLNTPQAKKFWDTLRIIKQQNLFDISKGE